MYYLLRKLKGRDEALALLNNLRRLVKVSSVGEVEIAAAFASGFRDFEDAVQHFAAKAESGVGTIVTRNKVDFVASEIPIRSPEEYLAKFDGQRP